MCGVNLPALRGLSETRSKTRALMGYEIGAFGGQMMTGAVMDHCHKMTGVQCGA